MAPTGKRRTNRDETCSTSKRRRWTKIRQEPAVSLVDEEIQSNTPCEVALLEGQSSARESSVGLSKDGAKQDTMSSGDEHTPATSLSHTTSTAACQLAEYVEAHNEKPPNLPYDVCFGLLLMEASCMDNPWETIPEIAPVQITCLDNVMMLRYEGSGENIGCLVSKVLPRLVREHSVTLAASLVAPKRPQSKASGDIRVRTLRVIVYGFLSSKDAVTTILDQGDLFLQHPEDSEYNRRVRYVNPMYFTRPGEEMPRIMNRSAAASQRQTSVTLDEDQLREAERSRLLRIFDEASGPDASLGSEVKQSSRIISTLKEHQLNALAMMIEREQGALGGNPKFPSLWEPCIEEGNRVYRHVVTKSLQCEPLPSLRGGILGDEMGLGKTLSTLALICHHLDRISDLTTPQATRMSRATLIVTPASTIYGWEQQIHRHIRSGEINSLVYHGRQRRVSAAELHNNDIVLTTYDTLRSDWATYGPLYNFSWARIVLDEAHKIRNCSSKIFQATCEVPAHYRWCLTGTPIQNSLDDFGSLLAFIGVPPFVTRDQFRFWISSPSLSDRRHSLHALRKLVRATCLRRTKSHPYLASTLKLPRKIERVEIVEFLPDEREMYEFFKRRSYLLANKDPNSDSKAPNEKRKKGQKANTKPESDSRKLRHRNTGNIFILISVLRMICDHGQALLPRVALEAWQNRDEGRVSLTLLQTASEENRSCCVCGYHPFDEDDEAKETRSMTEFPCKTHVACGTCVNPTDGATRACPECPTPEMVSSAPEMRSGTGSPQAPSSKVSALLRNIVAKLGSNDPKDETHSHAKSVIFSYWTGMLDKISSALGPYISSLNLSIVRIDGHSTLQRRRVALDQFNDDKSCVVMLATIGAVGEGIDLSVAFNVHIVEPHWNPMAEAQAVDRVHRIGQNRDVEVTRYYVKNSIEEYVQWVQNDKLRLINESLSSSEDSHTEKITEEENLQEQRWEKLFEFLRGSEESI